MESTAVRCCYKVLRQGTMVCNAARRRCGKMLRQGTTAVRCCCKVLRQDTTARQCGKRCGRLFGRHCGFACSKALRRALRQEDTTTRHCGKKLRHVTWHCGMPLRLKPKKGGKGGAFTTLCAFWSFNDRCWSTRRSSQFYPR